MGNVHMEATQINYREGDKKMSVAEALKNAGNTGLAHTADIAPEFSTTSAYSAGDFVYYNGNLYEFTANHAAGAWSTDDTQAATVGGKIASLEGDVANLSGVKANQITIAPSFNSETAYEPGDIVYYNGLTYRCTNDHEGAWDAEDFAATTIENELATLKSGLTELTNNSAGTSVDISSYTPSNPYVATHDGYIAASSELDTSGKIEVTVKGYANEGVLGYINMYVSGTYQVTSLYVRKGMRVFVYSNTTHGVVTFTPII